MRNILDWQCCATIQKEATGCIPTGYEFLLKMAKIEKVDYDNFQDNFNLNATSNDGNFRSVAEAIKKTYSTINFKILTYQKNEGNEKLAKIIELIGRNQPVLLSLNNSELKGLKGWHIMPVLGIWDENLLLLDHHHLSGISFLINIPFKKFVDIHTNLPGGNDIAFLE